jgi:hypothetical protein
VIQFNTCLKIIIEQTLYAVVNPQYKTVADVSAYERISIVNVLDVA